ncbi:hypothetical protein DPEC_G00138430 [Dallia pectoralis]|uniref:Uncharacterized protein n=1 Tax=Dallia pectoralis TaxID=75939 RepID=A0ACC2GMB3_DALPE|nr:hypothetical protein DPEC_G00138430 [Dallia pectoralis]
METPGHSTSPGSLTRLQISRVTFPRHKLTCEYKDKMKNRPIIFTCCSMILLALTMFCDGGHVLQCNKFQFDIYVHENCLAYFNHSMEPSDYRNTCPWPTFRGSYVALNDCVDEAASVTRCIEPSLKDAVFLEVHSGFFNLCSRLANPDVLVLILLIVPCVIATLLFSVLCVPLATKTSEGL